MQLAVDRNGKKYHQVSEETKDSQARIPNGREDRDGQQHVWRCREMWAAEGLGFRFECAIICGMKWTEMEGLFVYKDFCSPVKLETKQHEFLSWTGFVEVQVPLVCTWILIN